MKSLSTAFLVFIFLCASAAAQTTAFTYQGSLKDGAAPANANYDFEFALFDAPAGGSQIGGTISKNNVAVATGIFSVKLDFGSVFPGADRYLETRVRLAGQPGITTLAPRQLINSEPYSVKSLGAASADMVTAGNISGVLGASQGGTGIGPAPPVAGSFLRSDGVGWTASGILGSDIPGGSPSYIQNGTSQQVSSNFSISDTGTANIFDAVTQYNIGGQRAIRIIGGNTSTIVGIGAGSQSNTFNSPNNTYFGYKAGGSSLDGPGERNSFFGSNAGAGNRNGLDKAYFGSGAGAGGNSTSGNSFFGSGAGAQSAGALGSQNSFFGYNAGSNNTGAGNAVFGYSAGSSNTSENNNTFIGAFSNGAAGITNATSIGFQASVTQSNSLVLGNGVNVGIGTSAPVSRLHINGNNSNFALTFTNAANTAGRRGYRLAFDSDRFSFQSADDSGNFAANQMVINQASGNVGIGTATPNAKLQVAGGNVYIAQPNSLIITSPSGACWFITVNNAGALSTISVSCP